MKTVGIRCNLAKVLKRKGLTQGWLVKEAGLTISKVNELCQDKASSIRFEHLVRILEALEIEDLNELFIITIFGRTENSRILEYRNSSDYTSDDVDSEILESDNENSRILEFDTPLTTSFIEIPEIGAKTGESLDLHGLETPLGVKSNRENGEKGETPEEVVLRLPNGEVWHPTKYAKRFDNGRIRLSDAVFHAEARVKNVNSLDLLKTKIEKNEAAYATYEECCEWYRFSRPRT